MDTRRILEIVGGVALGSGLTVVAYEVVGRGVDSPLPGGDPSAMAAAEPGENKQAVTHGSAEGEVAAQGGGPSIPVPLHALPVDAEGHPLAYPEIYDAPKPMTEQDEQNYPRHGLVTSGAVTVRATLDLEGPKLGLLRAGTRVRVDAERSFGGGCTQGWHAIFPKGWICLNAGLTTGDEPPDDGTIDVADVDVSKAMPLDYWRVNHDGTPFFHRLPSYTEQDLSDQAGKDWLAAHGSEPMPEHPAQRPDDVPAVVKHYQNAGYYVTIASEHLKAKRHFLKTNRGTYARKYQLGTKTGSEFRGIALQNGAESLPVHWIVREMELQKRQSPGSGLLEGTGQVLERRTRHPFERVVRIGDYDYLEDAEGNLMRRYAVGVAEMLKRPPGVGAQEHWIHVDLSEQVLVAYIGDEPVFTTLVSTGKEPGMTPVGVHRVQSKHIVTSMRDQPPEDEAYSIEDVPWTQYFSNSVALHGAFWHGGFGLVRSHGCVNLSPEDARWLFGFTEPHLPAAWLAAVGDSESSPIVVTE